MARSVFDYCGKAVLPETPILWETEADIIHKPKGILKKPSPWRTIESKSV